MFGGLHGSQILYQANDGLQEGCGFVLLQGAAAMAQRRGRVRLCRGCGYILRSRTGHCRSMKTEGGHSIRGLWFYFATEDVNRGFDERGGKAVVAGAVDNLATGGGLGKSDKAVALALY